MGDPAKRRATYDDVLAAPENLIAEIIDGELLTQARPASPHALAATILGSELSGPFHRSRGGPGGWVLLYEPELHLNGNVLVPDMAGWRRERMPTMPDAAAFELPPDGFAKSSPRGRRLPIVPGKCRFMLGKASTFYGSSIHRSHPRSLPARRKAVGRSRHMAGRRQATRQAFRRPRTGARSALVQVIGDTAGNASKRGGEHRRRSPPLPVTSAASSASLPPSAPRGGTPASKLSSPEFAPLAPWASPPSRVPARLPDAGLPPFSLAMICWIQKKPGPPSSKLRRIPVVSGLFATEGGTSRSSDAPPSERRADVGVGYRHLDTSPFSRRTLSSERSVHSPELTSSGPDDPRSRLGGAAPENLRQPRSRTSMFMRAERVERNNRSACGFLSCHPGVTDKIGTSVFGYHSP